MIGSYSCGQYAMPVFDSRTEEQKAHDAMNKRRREWYGLDWYKKDLWGNEIKEVA